MGALLTLLGQTSVLFWGQTTQILGSLSPKRDCSPKGVERVPTAKLFPTQTPSDFVPQKRGPWCEGLNVCFLCIVYYIICTSVYIVLDCMYYCSTKHVNQRWIHLCFVRSFGPRQVTDAPVPGMSQKKTPRVVAAELCYSSRGPRHSAVDASTPFTATAHVPKFDSNP